MKAPASQIGSYEIQRPNRPRRDGRGFLAPDARLNRHVAIKVLPEHLSSDADRLARFRREAKVLASLNHPNIGAIYGLEEANSTSFWSLSKPKRSMSD